MKIKYQFANGEHSEIEVSDEIGTVIIEDRKAEHSLEERNRCHCYSLDAALYEGEDYAASDATEEAYLSACTNQKLCLSLLELTEKQRRRFLMYADGLSYREIARLEGVDHKQIAKSIEGARKIMKKHLKNL